MIAFTGSTRAGRAVGALAGQQLKRAHLELGGNTALIVLDDVDLDRRPSIGACGSFIHQGQICMTTGRHLVARADRGRVRRRAGRAGRRSARRQPATDQVHLGPIIDAGSATTSTSWSRRRVDAGATVAAGGTYEEPFYRPTVLADVTLRVPAYAEEVFGPVARCISFADLDEAVELARDTEYGLSLGILTGDGLHGARAGRADPHRRVHINDQTVDDEAGDPVRRGRRLGHRIPLGGARANLDAYTETQWVTAQSELPAYPF